MMTSSTSMNSSTPLDLGKELINRLPDTVLKTIDSDDFDSLLAYIQSELELRVGQRLLEGLSDDEAEEFRVLVDTDAPDEITLPWVSLHCPDYGDVIRSTMVEILDATVARLTTELTG